MKEEFKTLKEKDRGIFDTIENAITFYLLEKKLNKAMFWKYGLNFFELSLFIEEYLITGNTKIDKLSGFGK